MKKGNFKAALVAVLVAFTFLFVGVQSGHAQNELTDDVYTAPAGNYMNSTDAEFVLTDQVAVLANFLQTLQPGSPQFKITVRATVFYRNILTAVLDGKQIPESIETGTQVFTTSGYGEYTISEKFGLRDDAVEMLSN